MKPYAPVSSHALGMQIGHALSDEFPIYNRVIYVNFRDDGTAVFEPTGEPSQGDWCIIHGFIRGMLAGLGQASRDKKWLP